MTNAVESTLASLMSKINTASFSQWSARTLQRAVGWADAMDATNQPSKSTHRQALLQACMFSKYLNPIVQDACETYYASTQEYNRDKEARLRALEELNYLMDCMENVLLLGTREEIEAMVLARCGEEGGSLYS
jgi:hypothetical protein